MRHLAWNLLCETYIIIENETSIFHGANRLLVLALELSSPAETKKIECERSKKLFHADIFLFFVERSISL